MYFADHDEGNSKKLVGVTVVALIHALVFYAILNGLGKQIVSIIKELPIETKLIEEIKPPPPPPPEPQTKPKLVTPPKPFVPIPEVKQPPVPSVIQEVTTVEPPKTEISVQSPPGASETGTGPSLVRAVVDFSTCAKPDYPRNALSQEQHGTVRIQFLIGLDGRVADSRIQKSSGYKTLDSAAQEALNLCKFKPGTINGIPQQSWTVVEYVWKLPD